MAHWASFLISDYLTFAFEFHLVELAYIAELPSLTSASFDLDGHVSSSFVGCNDVVMGDVACEGSCD